MRILNIFCSVPKYLEEGGRVGITSSSCFTLLNKIAEIL